MATDPYLPKTVFGRVITEEPFLCIDGEFRAVNNQRCVKFIYHEGAVQLEATLSADESRRAGKALLEAADAIEKAV